MEIIKAALQSEQEMFIKRLASELSTLQENYEGMQEEFEKTQKKAKSYRTKLKQTETEFAEQKAIYRKTKADAQRYSERLHEVNQTYQSTQNETSNMKKMHDDALVELNAMQQEFNQQKAHNQKLLEENSQLNDRLDDTIQMLQKSEKERLELRDMYLGVNERIEDLVRHNPGADQRRSGKVGTSRRKHSTNHLSRPNSAFSDGVVSASTLSTNDDGSHYDEMDGYNSNFQPSSRENIYALKKKLTDLHRKLDHESTGRRELKTQLKQAQISLKDRSDELESAHHIIRRCQNKLEKYRKRVQEISTKMDKTELEVKREKREIEEQLDREKRSMAELTREFQKRLDQRAEEYERQFKNSYETKILDLQREVSSKDAQLQKQNLQQLLDAQLAGARAQQQPEQMDRMVQMLEQKIENYQKEYISKHQHQLLLKETENRLRLEKKQARNEVELEYKQKLAQLEQDKTREMNHSLLNIKQAVKSMETALEQEKISAKRMAEKLESERKMNETLKLSLQGQDSDKRNLLQHLEEATEQINTLRDELEARVRSLKQLQEERDDMIDKCNKLESELERIGAERRTLDSVVESNKKEIIGLRDRLDETARKNDESNQRYNSQFKDLSTMSERVGAEREHVVNSVISVIRTVLGNNAAFSDRRRRSEISVEDVTEELQSSILRTKKEYESEIIKLKEQIDQMRISSQKNKWSRAQHNRKLEMALRERLQMFRKDLGQLRNVAEKEIIDVKHDVSGFMQQVSRRIEDITSDLSDDQQRTLRRLDNEKAAIMDEYEGKLRIKQQELMTAHTRNTEQVTQLESRMAELEKKRDELAQAAQLYQVKFEDLRRALRVIDAYIPIPLDCQTRILSNERETVNIGFTTLQQILDTSAKDKTRTDAELQQFKRKSDHSQQALQQLQQTKSQLEDELGHLREINNSIAEEKKIQKSEYELQLISMKDQIGSLIEKQEELSLQKDEEKRQTVLELREQYSKKLQQLHQKMGSTNAQMDEFRTEKSRLGGELHRVTSRLENDFSS